MKKHFGFWMLLVAFVLTCCGINNAANEKARVQFSIPVSDIIALKNTASRGASADDSSIYKIIVQLENDNYYTSALACVDDSNIRFEDDGCVKNPDGDDVTFVFEDLKPAYYNVLIDIVCEYTYLIDDSQTTGADGGDATEPKTNTSIYLAYTGEQKLNVIAGQDNPVTVTLSDAAFELSSDFNLVATYKVDSTLKTEVFPYEDYVDSGLMNDDGNFIQPRCRGIELTDKNDIKICIADDGASSGSTEYPLEELYLVAKDDSHFSAKGFEYKPALWGNFTDTRTYEVLDNYNISVSADDGKMNLLEGYKKLSAAMAKNFKNENCTGHSMSLQVDISYKGNNDSAAVILNQYFRTPNTIIDINKIRELASEIEEPEPNPFTDTAHGSLLNTSVSEEGNTQSVHELTFEKRSSITDKSRYIYSAKLDDILKGKTLSDGDSVVFVMRLPSTYTLAFNQFYYELQVSDWERITDDDLFENNECINCDRYPAAQDGYYTFIMPLNFVVDPQDYDEILFFFDLKDQDETSLENAPASQELPVAGFDYFIFPADTKTFVLGIGQNWDPNTNQTYPYRYEFKLPLKTDTGACVFEGGETVTVALNGTVMSYYNEDNQLNSVVYTSDADFYGEIFDGAQYAVGKSFTGCNEYFHPLSNTGDDQIVNVLNISVIKGNFASDGTYEFNSIQTPCYDIDVDETAPTTHKYQFQCETRCSDPTKLLVIQNFGMVTTVTAATAP